MSDSSTSVPQPSDSRDDPGLTRLIYGAMPLGGSWSADDPLTEEQEEVGFAALDAAEEAGYRDLDLADIYAAGKSETVVGRWLAQDPQRRQRMQVQTKAGIRIPGGTAAGDAPMHYRLDAATVREMGVVAHNLGNRHLPAQFFGPEEPFPDLEGHDGVMVIQYDHTAEHYLEHLGVRHARMERSMPVPFRHAEHTH